MFKHYFEIVLKVTVSGDNRVSLDVESNLSHTEIVTLEYNGTLTVKSITYPDDTRISYCGNYGAYALHYAKITGIELVSIRFI